MRLCSVVVLGFIFVSGEAAFGQGVSPGPNLPSFNVKTFDAVCDGVADDTAGFKAAMNAISNSAVGGELSVPGGDCVVSTSLALTIGANQPFVMATDGLNGARIHFTNQASAGFAVTMLPVAVWLPSGPSVTVRNVTFISDWTATAGTALAITQNDPGSGTFARNPTPSVVLDHVSFQGNTGSSSWLNGARLFGTNITRVDQISFVGITGDSTSTMLTYNTDSNISTMVDHTIIAPFMLHGGTAIKIGTSSTSNNIQGFDIWRPSFTGNAVGVDYECQNAGACDGLNVSQGQINTTGIGILGVNVSTVKIHDVYFIGSATQTTGYISLTGGQGHSIQNNKFSSSGGGSEIAAVLANVAGTSTLPGAKISGNTFSTFGHSPINVSGTSDYIIADNNQTTSIPLLNNSSSGTHNYEVMSCLTGASCNSVNGVSNTIGSGSTGVTITGDSNTVAASIKNVTITGGGNIVSGSNSTISGFQNNSTATNGTDMFGRRLQDNGWNGCVFDGYQVSGNVGGTEHFHCVWGLTTASGAQTRVTQDGGAASVGAHNCLNPAANSLVSFTGITIAMQNQVTVANSGSWFAIPAGQLREGAAVADTVWTGGATPTALGTAFTVSLAADTSKGCLDLELTPPSANSTAFTFTFDGTIAH